MQRKTDRRMKRKIKKLSVALKRIKISIIKRASLVRREKEKAVN